MIETLSISTLWKLFIWKLFIWLPKFITLWIFSKDKLPNLVMFDVMPRNEYARVDLGETPKFDLYFHLTNLLPIDIELEQAEIIFVCAGARLKSIYVKRVTIKPGETKLIHTNESIHKGEADKIANHYKDNNSHISATLEFNCKLHNFTKDVPALQGVKPEFVNVQNKKL